MRPYGRREPTTVPKFIKTERNGRVLTVTIARPAVRNALNAAACHELSRIWDEFEADPELWIAIVTGEGDRAFCAGHDLSDEDPMPDTGWAGLSSRLTTLSKPMIAAVNGNAYGGGFELALGCDIIVADEGAAFAMSEPRVGFVALGGGADRLVRRLPAAIAMGLLLTGRRIDAREAHRWGIVNEVAPTGAVLERAQAWAEEILLCSPLAVRFTKQLALASLEGSEWTAARIAQRAQVLDDLAKTDDLREGVEAFTQKRAPQWSGS
jgi:enoyl-CoA hydratase/carnithine racemase